MNTDKLLEVLEEKRDNFNRNRDDYCDHAFYQNIATVDALNAVIAAVLASLQSDQDK